MNWEDLHITVTVILPAVYDIDLRDHGNWIRQISAPSWRGVAVIEPYTHRRVRGFLVTPGDGAPATLVIANSAKPPAEFSHVLRLRPGSDSNGIPDDFSSARWICHPRMSALGSNAVDYARVVEETRDSWRGAFTPVRDDPGRNVRGLRPPQIGAVYAVQSHWTVNADVATVVLPTGVGKTETMLALLVAERCERLLVVVPTDALRTQIAEKFLTLGLLKSPEFKVVSDSARFPVVGVLNHRPSDVAGVDSFFGKCNVVVTTMSLAGQCSPEIMSRMAEQCPCLFIDEAHHVAAPRWRAFKDAFSKSRIVQFTATPFRNDDRPIGGRRIFTFTLRHAQEQGYFRPIRFKPVMEFDPRKRDSAVAEAAVEQLRAEADLGHILMARVESVARAEEVFESYRRYPEFSPVQIHTGIKSQAERDSIRRKLLSGESRIVVCVDMLGEGFDLPELKIAAFHDIRKTLSVTLQLAGRFTRAKPNLGNATFVANVADLDVQDELRRLYQHDSDWNALLPDLSEKANASDAGLAEFLQGFQELPEEITLGNVRPAMSTVVYRTTCTSWNPENFAEGIPGFDSLDREYHALNPHNNTLVVVTTRRVSVSWAQIDEIHDWDWQLYVLYWDRVEGLLFIHNSSNSGFFKRLAEAVAGEVEQVRGPKIFRCLAGINRLVLQNVGLLEQLGRLIRYTMRAGSDVEPALTPAHRHKAIKANLFGQGYERGARTTIGCSYKGRIWSYRTANLLELTKWCSEVGSKLNDEALDPEEVLRGTLEPVLVAKRPFKVPVAVEWPDIVHREPERLFDFLIGGKTVYLCDASLRLVNTGDSGSLSFTVVGHDGAAAFAIDLVKRDGDPDYAVRPLDNTEAVIRHGRRMVPLREFFEEHPPTFWFADGSSLTGAEYVELRRQPEPFPRDRIEVWDWSGTNIRTESQGVTREPKSIQFRVIRELNNRDFSVVFDDDDHGEAADVVAISEHADRVEVEFWHCKYATEDTPGRRIAELYEVCGQAQKSVRWHEQPRDLITHLLRREPRHRGDTSATRFEFGAEADLHRIREKMSVQRLQLKIFIVQPGMSKSRASREQLELLAVTENYLMETFAVPFAAIGSA